MRESDESDGVEQQSEQRGALERTVAARTVAYEGGRYRLVHFAVPRAGDFPERLCWFLSGQERGRSEALDPTWPSPCKD